MLYMCILFKNSIETSSGCLHERIQKKNYFCIIGRQ